MGNSILAWVCDGSFSPIIAAFTMQLFGKNRGNEVFGYVFNMKGLSNLVTIFIVLFVKPVLGSTGALLICLASSIAAAVINIK